MNPENNPQNNSLRKSINHVFNGIIFILGIDIDTKSIEYITIAF